jgi:hypothetical protein
MIYPPAITRADARTSTNNLGSRTTSFRGRSGERIKSEARYCARIIINTLYPLTIEKRLNILSNKSLFFLLSIKGI